MTLYEGNKTFSDFHSRPCLGLLISLPLEHVPTTQISKIWCIISLNWHFISNSDSTLRFVLKYYVLCMCKTKVVRPACHIRMSLLSFPICLSTFYYPIKEKMPPKIYRLKKNTYSGRQSYLRPGSWAPPGRASWHWQIHWRPPCYRSWGRRPVGRHATGGRSAWPGCISAPWEWHSLSPPGDVRDEKRGNIF